MLGNALLGELIVRERLGAFSATVLVPPLAKEKAEFKRLVIGVCLLSCGCRAIHTSSFIKSAAEIVEVALECCGETTFHFGPDGRAIIQRRIEICGKCSRGQP